MDNDNPTTPPQVPTEPVTPVEPAVQPPVQPTVPEPPAEAAPAVPPVPSEPTPVPVEVTAPAPAVDEPGHHKKRVLLVEDDDALATVYQTRFDAEGLETRRVPNGEDALAAALEFKPNLILLDVMMPKVSGFDVLDILRNTPETTNIKVVMLTALSQETDKERAEGLGADDYLVKSQVVIADVVSRVKQHLGL